MEENIKEKSANKQQRSFFCRNIQIPIFGVLIVVVFISLLTYALISVISLNNRVKTLEEKKPIESVSTTSQEMTAERTKRSTQPTKIEIMTKLIKMEERLNQSYHSVGRRQPAFVLRGPPGKPGRDGMQGRDGIPGTKGRDGRDGGKGPKGDQGTSGQQGPQGISGQKGEQGNPGVSGVSYIRWGKKTCPTTGAKLVYEGYVGGSHYNGEEELQIMFVCHGPRFMLNIKTEFKHSVLSCMELNMKACRQESSQTVFTNTTFLASDVTWIPEPCR